MRHLTATNAKYASYSVTGTIIDNEQPAVSVSDASATENAEIMVFNLSLSFHLMHHSDSEQ